MITSFFRTSKPLHYLIFLVLFFAIFVFQSFYNHNINQSPISYVTLFGVFFLFLATFFVYVFIITKNYLTQKNSFAALYLCLFIGIIPQFFLTPIVMLSNLFVLLGLRRIFSLKKNLNTKKKLFDAGFWIALATIFYPWAILYFVPLFVAILMITSDYFKNTFAVFFGALSVSLTSLTFRGHMARLIEKLINEEQLEKAEEIADLAMQKMPVDIFGYYVYLEPFIGAYYETEADDKARALYKEVVVKYQESLNYFSGVSDENKEKHIQSIYFDIERYKSLVDTISIYEDEVFVKAEMEIFNGFLRLFTGEEDGQERPDE